MKTFKKFLSEELKETHINIDGVHKHRYNSKDELIHSSEDGIKNFHKWFGDSDSVDEKGRPKVFYHGVPALESTQKEDTPHPFTEFDKSGSGLYSFSENERFAEQYATTKQMDSQSDLAPFVFKTYLKTKTFDPKNPEHINLLRKHLPDEVVHAGKYGWSAWGGETKIPKEKFLESLQGIYDVHRPLTKEMLDSAQVGKYVTIDGGQEYVHHKTDTHLYASPAYQITYGIKKQHLDELRQEAEKEPEKIVSKTFRIHPEGEDRPWVFKNIDVSIHSHTYLPKKAIGDNWEATENDELKKTLSGLGFNTIKQIERNNNNVAVFNPDQIKSSKNNSGEFDSNKMSIVEQYDEDQISNITKSNRYNVTHIEPMSYSDGYDVHFESKKPDSAEYYDHYTNVARKQKGKTSWYDPNYATLERHDIGESFETQKPTLKPEYSSEIQTDKTKNLIYRGISSEEYEKIKKTGVISSNGDFNMSGQEGLTYFSTDHDAAKHYAHGFAPVDFQASADKPAYVIGVKNPGNGVRIAGTGEHEIGIPSKIPSSDIEEVHQGIPYASHSGYQGFIKDWGDKEYKKGSSAQPTTSLLWKKLDHKNLTESINSSEHPMIMVDGVQRHVNNSEGQPIHHTYEGISNFYKWFGDSKAVDKHGRPEVFYHGTGADIEKFSHDFVGKGHDAHGSGFYFTNKRDVGSSYGMNSFTGTGNVLPVYLKLHKSISTDDDKGFSRGNIEQLIKSAPEHIDSLQNFGEVDTPRQYRKALSDAIDSYSDLPKYHAMNAISNDFYDQNKPEFLTNLVKHTRHDHVIDVNGDHKIVVVFHPRQIKSAIGNNGSYSKKSHNLTEEFDPDKQVSNKILTEAFDSAIKQHTSLTDPVERRRSSNIARKSMERFIGTTNDGKTKSLFSTNKKLSKAITHEDVKLPDGLGVETIGLSLAPAFQHKKWNTCPNSTSCKEACIGQQAGAYFQFGGGVEGVGGFHGAQKQAYLARTHALISDPHSFAIRAHDEINVAKYLAELDGNHLSVRMNVLSDLHPRIFKSIIQKHPEVTFMDYTKNNTEPVAPNHHVTYSSTGITHVAEHNDGVSVENPDQNWHQMRKRLRQGRNVAMAFSHKSVLPSTVHDIETGETFHVIDGDQHDYRPLDGKHESGTGYIVGLKNKAKGTQEKTASVQTKGFMVHFDPKITKIAGKIQKDESGNIIHENTKVFIPPQNRQKFLMTNDGEKQNG